MQIRFALRHQAGLCRVQRSNRSRCAARSAWWHNVIL
jgi:hypothetical protein